MDILPGKYTLEVDQTQLDFLGATNPQGALKFEIKALSQGDYIEGLKIVLTAEAEKSGK